MPIQTLYFIPNVFIDALGLMALITVSTPWRSKSLKASEHEYPTEGALMTFSAKQEAFDLLDENDFVAVVLIIVDERDTVEFAVQMKKGSSPAAMRTIEAVHSVLMGSGVANKEPI